MGFVLIFRSLMNFELFLIICGKDRSNCIQYLVVCIWNSKYPSIICWKDYSPLTECQFVKNQLTIRIWVYLCTLHSILLICMSVFMPLWSYLPHSSTLAWKIPWMEEPGRLQSMGSLRVGHDWATSLSLFTFLHWRRKWQPTPVFLPGESQGQGSLVGCQLWGHTESGTTEVT